MAVIGMTSPRLSQLENTVDISVCVLLSQRVENTQTVFVTTQEITATGEDRNLCAVLCHTISIYKVCSTLPRASKGKAHVQNDVCFLVDVLEVVADKSQMPRQVCYVVCSREAYCSFRQLPA